MEFEFIGQAVAFVFENEDFENGKKSRTFRNVKEGANPAGLKKVGNAMLALLDEKTTLTGIEIIEHKTFNLDAEV